MMKVRSMRFILYRSYKAAQMLSSMDGPRHSALSILSVEPQRWRLVRASHWQHDLAGEV